MSAVKYLDLTGLQSVVTSLKGLISDGDAKSFKSAKFDENTRVLSLFKAESTDGTADFTVEIPETDVSGLLEKIADGTVGNIVTVGADGTVVDSGVALAVLATKEEVKAVDEKAEANAEAIEAINNADTGILKQAKDYADAEVKELADGAVKTNAEAISVLNGNSETEGSVAKTVKDAVDVVDKKVGTLDDLETTSKTDLVVAINEVRNSVSAGGTQAAVTMTSDTTTEGMLKSYTIKQGDNTVGVIDIPKDLVVTSGTIEVDPEGQTVGTYIKLVIANQEDPLYINVGTLVDLYTAEENATQIQLTVDNITRKISAVIVDGSVDSDALAANAVTTAKIADANVTLAKLSTDAKNAFDSAGAATAAETNAKTHATNLNNAMDTRVTELESKVGDGIEAISTDEINGLFV